MLAMTIHLGLRQVIGLVAGPALFTVVLLTPLPEGMSPEALKVAAVALLMASLWIAESVPIPVTAILPIFLFPLLGVMPTGEVTPNYGNSILFLFMGGFLIAIAMQRWHLHRRIALHVILTVGSSPQRLVLGFMLATAMLSMWISNSATAMMMMPVAMAVIEQTRAEHGDNNGPEYAFGTSLMLAIAYGASIGGIATLVGTPPNAIFIGIIDELYGFQIAFVDWMKLGLPVSLVMLAICWLMLTRVVFRLHKSSTDSRSAHAHLEAELAHMGPISPEELRVAIVFTLVALTWIANGLFELPYFGLVADPSIAMAGAFVLFLIPASAQHKGFLLDWDTAKGIPWDIIILMGGGFALASGFSSSGLTQWLASEMTVLQGVNSFALILAVVLGVTFLTEVSSNAATASLFIPVMGALALAMGLHPYTLMVPAALAASMAFMLPVATPPNAIVFGSRYVSIAQMVKAGLWMNLLSALVISVACYYLMGVLGRP